MAYNVEKPLPSPKKVLTDLSLSEESIAQVEKDRDEIKAILSGEDPRKLLIIGPCSAWPSSSVIEYVKALKPIAKKVADQLKIIIRCYIQKPRTTIGWLGPVNQPDPYEESDIEKGIYYCREMMLEILKHGFPIADEAVFTHNDEYFLDLLSWIAIGARSCEDQEHRIFASMIPHPVGIKNPTSGNIQIGINSLIAAQHPHTFAFHNQQIKTSGNDFAHLILRGGAGKPNCGPEKLHKAVSLLRESGLKNPSLIVDVSHDNSIRDGIKDPLNQPETLACVIEHMQKDPHMHETIKGFMVESFLKDGKQDMKQIASDADLEAGLSITDGCLGLEKSLTMIEDLAGKLGGKEV